MRWSIVRIIWARELKDQLRDRRTLFMIAVLPILLYPVLGFAVLQLALGFVQRESRLGIVQSVPDSRDFPPRAPIHAAPGISWLAIASTTSGGALDGVSGTVALVEASRRCHDFPRLLEDGKLATGENGSATSAIPANNVRFIFLTSKPGKSLADGEVDLLIRAPSDFYDQLANDQTPLLRIRGRPGDDRSEQALNRLFALLQKWKHDVKSVRFIRKGLPSNFDEPFVVMFPEQPPGEPQNVFGTLIQIFPSILIMLCLAGALYPAVDVCAGEKERGTMETLLISPAGRREIVWGKFLTIWVFSAAMALLNLASMGLTTWYFGGHFTDASLSLGAVLWSVVLVFPLSAFFSAISLAIGVYARSSKEGQYYLMPLFLITMPLSFLTLAPGVKLSPFYSLVPVTGVALLLQQLVTASSLDQVPWFYFIPVLAPIALYSAIALRWAIEQFQREEVLFREAERLDITLWLRKLFREKEPLPTTGQALFCFGMILFLRWLSSSLGLLPTANNTSINLAMNTTINLLAFVLAPTFFIAIILTTNPVEGFKLKRPSWQHIGLAAVLAMLLLPPLAGLAQLVFAQFPALTELLEDRQPLMRELQSLAHGVHGAPLPIYLFAFAVLPAVCEELAFRGFILTGLMRFFRPRNAVLFSSFLFAIFHLNVFQFLPAFLLGVVLGLLTVRAKSVWPAVLLHLLHNSLLIISIYIYNQTRETYPNFTTIAWPVVIVVGMVFGFALLWWLYRKPYVDLERRLALEEQEESGKPTA